MTSILVIEDEINLLKNVLEILSASGLEVHGAEDGVEGVEMARKVMPDMIICDIAMPEMDGYGVLMELNSDPQTSNIPFVFLTAFDNREYMRKGMEMGADDYLTKPFSSSELLGMINTQLEKHHQRQLAHEAEMSVLRNNIIMALPHELRTPLSGIVTCADMLMLDFEEGMFDEERAQRMVQIIHNAGTRLHRVIENYLVYAQIELFSQDPVRRSDLLRNEGLETPTKTAILAAHQAAEQVKRDEDIAVGSQSEAPVTISEMNLNKVIQELIDNALKFSEPGNSVEIASAVQGDHYVLTVKDQGRGMSKDQVNTIGAYMQFERRFYEQQGMGLGLVIAKRLVELHNGQLVIESEPKAGTTIYIYLPIAA